MGISKIFFSRFLAIVVLGLQVAPVDVYGQSNPDQLCIKTRVWIKLEGENKTRLEIPAGSFFRVESFDKEKNTVQIKFDETPVVLKGKSFQWAPSVECLQPYQRSKFKQFQTFSFYMGSLLNISNKSFDNMITPIKNPNSVSSLPNPIVEKVQLGSGWEFGSCYKKPFSKSVFAFNFCGYYQSIAFEAIERPNPNPASETTALSQLSSAKKKYEYQKIGGIAEIDWYWLRTRRNLSSIGIFSNASYFLTEIKKFDYRTGTVFKAEENSIETGPSGSDLDFGLSADYIYFFNSKIFIKSTGIKVEYNLSGTLGLKVSLGF